MSTRAELETALATAETDWRSANGDMDKAHSRRAKANTVWDNVVTNRRKTDADERKANTAWDNAFPDWRKADADRRNPGAVLLALSNAVADRHTAYIEWNNAEVDWAEAVGELEAATAVRKQAIAALDELNRAQKKPKHTRSRR